MNREGGTLFIGVDDDGNILGLDEDYKTLKKKNSDGLEIELRQSLERYLHDKIINELVQINFHNFDGREICEIIIKKSPKPIVLSDEGKQEFYVRIGNSSKPYSFNEFYEYCNRRFKIWFISINIMIYGKLVELKEIMSKIKISDEISRIFYDVVKSNSKNVAKLDDIFHSKRKWKLEQLISKQDVAKSLSSFIEDNNKSNITLLDVHNFIQSSLFFNKGISILFYYYDVPKMSITRLEGDYPVGYCKYFQLVQVPKSIQEKLESALEEFSQIKDELIASK